MIKCGSCGRENDDSFKFCLDCGSPLMAGAEPTPATAPSSAAVKAAPAATAARSTAAKATAAKSPPPKPTGATAAAPPMPPASKSRAAAPAAVPPPVQPVPVLPPDDSPAPAPDESPATAAASPEAAAPAAGTCPKCGTPAKPNDGFCSSCGHRLGGDTTKGATMFMHVASPSAVKKPRARLVLVKPDGSEGTVFSLAAEKTTLGRSQGVIMFPKDSFISPRHAEIQFKDSQLSITDLDSLNGVYRKMTEESRISPGTYFRIGRQLLRLEVPGDFQPLPGSPPAGDDSQFWGSPVPQVWSRLVQVLEGGKIGEIHLLTQAEVMIGREEGEVRFPEDGFVSSRHCLLTNRDGDCFLRDLGSSNGTYLRILGSMALAHDDRIQIGNQVLRVDMT